MRTCLFTLILLLFCAGSTIAQNTKSGHKPRKGDKVLVKTPESGTITGVAENQESYYKGLTESEKTTPVFKYVTDKDKSAVYKNAVMPSDTVITPTIRYYPKRKE